jgi:integrase
MVSGLTLHDIEGMQSDIAAGKSARRRNGRGGRATGGAGVAGHTVGTLRGLLGHAARLKIVLGNPAEGVRQLAGERRQPRLNADELGRLGKVLREAAAEGKHSTGLAAIRLMLLTGFRRMEAFGPQAAMGQSEGALHSLPGHERWRTASRDWKRSGGLHRGATKPRRVPLSYFPQMHKENTHAASVHDTRMIVDEFTPHDFEVPVFKLEHCPGRRLNSKSHFRAYP